MSKFYGTLFGRRQPKTSCGSSSIVVCAQSWNGSIISKLSYDGDETLDNLYLQLSVAEGSNTVGKTIYYGKFKDLEKILEQQNIS